jgi:hypothetical protein
MTMFDHRAANVIGNFGDEYNTPEYKFRQHASFTLSPDEEHYLFYARANGQSKEFLRISKAEYERCIRLPVQTARQGGSYSTRFFAWHWLEETNQLDLFFNTLKELQNA